MINFLIIRSKLFSFSVNDSFVVALHTNVRYSVIWSQTHSTHSKISLFPGGLAMQYYLRPFASQLYTFWSIFQLD